MMQVVEPNKTYFINNKIRII